MKKVFIMLGCPGSGKSTYVAKKRLPYVSRDQIRIDLGYCGENEKYLGTREEEEEVTKEHSRIIGEYMSKGLNFFIFFSLSSISINSLRLNLLATPSPYCNLLYDITVT